MQRYKQYEPLVISSLVAEKWPHPLHNHNYFELTYIAEGDGIHKINGKKIPYRRGYLFLLGPEDEHEFCIRKKTTFIYLKFTSLYFRDHPFAQDTTEWNRNIDHLLFFVEKRSCNLLQDCEDQVIIRHLFQAALIAKEKKQILYETLIFQLISFALSLIKEQNSADFIPMNSNDHSVIEALLMFIGDNIHEPKKLTLNALSENFHYSPNYIGTLFKKKMGVTLSDYINLQKLRLIERRLKYGKSSVKEIAFDFGFVDESHFNKFFKKQKGLTPSAYKEACMDC